MKKSLKSKLESLLVKFEKKSLKIEEKEKLLDSGKRIVREYPDILRKLNSLYDEIRKGPDYRRQCDFEETLIVAALVWEKARVVYKVQEDNFINEQQS